MANRSAGSVACFNADWSVERSYSQPDASHGAGEGYLCPLRRELQPLFTCCGIHEPLATTQLKVKEVESRQCEAGWELLVVLENRGPKNLHTVGTMAYRLPPFDALFDF